MDNGWAATVALSQTTGDGYIDGGEFEAYSYFLNVAKDFGEDHKLSFTAFGAPQEHGQRFDAELISTFRDSDRGTKFNRDFGYRNGQVYNASTNFYHKPQMSLNHYWTYFRCYIFIYGCVCFFWYRWWYLHDWSR